MTIELTHVNRLSLVNFLAEPSPPQRLLHWRNGEKTGIFKNRRRAGDDGKGQKSLLFFSLPSVPRALSFPFSPAPAPSTSSLPIPQPTGKTNETSAEERS